MNDRQDTFEIALCVLIALFVCASLAYGALMIAGGL